MVTPHEIFPEDKIDPTVDLKKFDMPVEDTLAIVNHLKVVKRRRAPWRFLQIEPNDPRLKTSSPDVIIRRVYDLPPEATVAHQGNMWAAWAGGGKPTCEAFDKDDIVSKDAAEIAGPIRAMLGAGAGAALPADLPFHDDYVELAAGESAVRSPGHDDADSIDPADDHASMKASLEAIAPTTRQEYERQRAERLRKEREKEPRWIYCDRNVEKGRTLSDAELRKRYGARDNAPVMIDPAGIVAAVWVGDGAPTRLAFPDPDPMDPIPANPYARTPEPPRMERVRVSPQAAESTLHEMGLKLYGLSKDPAFSQDVQKTLLHMSDTLHREAGKIETIRVRAAYDRAK
jgi:hypothetical protein